jgi:hypothetical protein
MPDRDPTTDKGANSKKCQVEKDEYDVSKRRLSGLMISGMALSNQSDLSPFLSPRKANLKIGLILENDLPRMVKSRK